MHLKTDVYILKDPNVSEQVFSSILTHRTYEQRKEIANIFYEKHGKDFRDLLFSKVSGFLRIIMYDLMYSPTEIMAHQLHYAVQGPIHYGTKPGHFETLKIHCPTSEGVSEVSERANE